jgi:hypothetical protein
MSGTARARARQHPARSNASAHLETLFNLVRQALPQHEVRRVDLLRLIELARLAAYSAHQPQQPLCEPRGRAGQNKANGAAAAPASASERASARACARHSAAAEHHPSPIHARRRGPRDPREALFHPRTLSGVSCEAAIVTVQLKQVLMARAGALTPQTTPLICVGPDLRLGAAPHSRAMPRSTGLWPITLGGSSAQPSTTRFRCKLAVHSRSRSAFACSQLRGQRRGERARQPGAIRLDVDGLHHAVRHLACERASARACRQAGGRM